MMCKGNQIATTITILEENVQNDMNSQKITFQMTHTLLHSRYYSALCKNKRDVCFVFKKIESQIWQIQ